MTVAESLLQISNLTKQNLQILRVLNDAFYTKANHLSTRVGDVTYNIPSYIALENKVNHIQDAFNNLVHAAKAGEAWFNFDGNSKEIMVRGYQQAPNPVTIDLSKLNFFGAETKELFKDMLTPQPYLNFDLSSIPDDCNEVVVKKIIPYHEDLKNSLVAEANVNKDGVPTARLDWPTLQRCLGSHAPDYIPGTDYLEYETIYTLPLRENTRTGSYVIEEILKDEVNADLENVITFRIHQATPLTSWDQDGIVEKDLVAGDILVTWDGSAKLKILKIQPAARTIECLVMSGEYVNAVAAGNQDKTYDELLDSVADYSKLRLFSVLTEDRYIHVPLEEDKYVYIAIAPINKRLNTRSEWGTGVYVNTDQLKKDNADGTGFRTYYNQNVKNIGDAIIEFSSVMFPPITKYTTNQVAAMKAAPVLDTANLQVVQINKHLNEAEAVKNIRALYAQKKQYQSDLSEIQSKIRTLNDELVTISFDDMSGMRSVISAQITDLKTQQNNIITSITKITESIATSANNAEVPLEGGKYRIRGFLDVDAFIDIVLKSFGSSDDNITTGNALKDNIAGIECQYRYKNPDIPQANVSVVNNFLFTEWSTYKPAFRERSISYKDGQYTVSYSDMDNSSDGKKTFNKSDNKPKFNQIDIPINQGEIVEVKARIIWGFGYPFVTQATAWSEPVDIEFPAELVSDVQVTTIIEENNSDIETNRFESILREQGVTSHVDDNIVDQDITYFHKPESISSGFYTSERRVIPLKDKLTELSNDITSIMDALQGTYSTALRTSFVYGNEETVLNSGQANNVFLPAYNTVSSNADAIPTGAAYKDSRGVVHLMAKVKVANITSHTVRLFSPAPGDPEKHVWETKREGISKLFKDESSNVVGSIQIKVPNADEPKTQKCNQVIIFPSKNPITHGKLIVSTGIFNFEPNNDSKIVYIIESTTTDISDLRIASSDMGGWKELAPGESFEVSFEIQYMAANENATVDLPILVRNNIYGDDTFYNVKLTAKVSANITDGTKTSQDNSSTTKYNVVVR